MNEYAKNFRKSLAVAGAIALTATASSCTRNYEKTNSVSTDNNANNINNKLSSPGLHGNPNYYEKDEIFIEYSYILNKLENQTSLNNKDILEISNIYKKLINSIDYIDSLSEDPEYFTVDELPPMKGLYTDIKFNLINLIKQNNLLLLPNNSLDFQKEEIIEQYLTFTGQKPLENIKIVNIPEDNKYCILDNNKIFFEIYLSDEKNAPLCISLKSNSSSLKNFNKLSSNSVFITEVNKPIPSIDLETSLER